MPQVFSAKMNVIARASIVAALAAAGILAVGRAYLYAFVVRNRHGSQRRAASAVQPPASRGRPGDRLPVLPYLGGALALCRHSAHEDLHELPFPDLGRQPDAGTGARELSHRSIAPLAPGLQPARIRLLRPQHPRPERHWLLDVPRADRRDALHLSSADAADGVVPRMPPQPGAADPPSRGSLQHPVPAARWTNSTWAASSSDNTASKILPPSPVARRVTDDRQKEPQCRTGRLRGASAVRRGKTVLAEP